MTDSKRIIFAGTPDFSVPPLRALLASAHRVVAVYTQPDRPSGRGRKLSPSPVKELALDAGIPVYQPVNFKDPGAVRELQSLGADLMVVVAYGLLLPKSVLDAPRLGCVNIHASVLPRWRGAAPIQRAVLAGDADLRGDHHAHGRGPGYRARCILIEEVPLAADETGGSLHDRLSVLGAEALMQALPGILDGSLVPEPQDDSRNPVTPGNSTSPRQ